MTDYEGFMTPRRSAPLHERDAFARRFKGGADPGALKEQRLAREQSAKQFAESMALQRQQYEDTKAIKTPVYAPTSPLAQGDPDVYNAGLDAKRSQKRRFGAAATRLAPPVNFPPVGAVPMGGVMQAA